MKRKKSLIFVLAAFSVLMSACDTVLMESDDDEAVAYLEAGRTVLEGGYSNTDSATFTLSLSNATFSSAVRSAESGEDVSDFFSVKLLDSDKNDVTDDIASSIEVTAADTSSPISSTTAKISVSVTFRTNSECNGLSGGLVLITASAEATDAGSELSSIINSGTSFTLSVAHKTGTLGATWDIKCGEKTFTYYTSYSLSSDGDDVFDGAVTGTLTNSDSSTVSAGYFKPTETNPYATLEGHNFYRLKLKINGTDTNFIAGAKKISSISKITKSNFENTAGVGYFVLRTYGTSSGTVSLAGIAGGTDNFRGIWVYNSDGECVASIAGNNTTLTTVTFPTKAKDIFYIYTNSGGFNNITVKAAE